MALLGAVEEEVCFMTRLTPSLEPLIFPYHAERPVSLKNLFGNTRPIELEIGFGNGDYLLKRSRECPDRNFIGVEQAWERVSKTLSKWTRDQHQSPPSQRFDNIRLFWMDARVALERFIPPRSLACLYSLFPEPWPKKSHWKHRLFSGDFLRTVNNRIAKNGVVKIVTDHRPYFDWILAQVPQAGFQVESKKIPAQYHTRYEQKWVQEGQTEFFELDLRKDQHWSATVPKDVIMKAFYLNHFFPEKYQMSNVIDETPVIFKDYFYDPHRQKAMVHLVVAEQNLTQHFWVMITKTHRGWCIHPLEGHTYLPTKGIAKALRLVYKTAKNCV